MLINYVPGQECRVAVVSSNGQLEDLHAERAGAASHVGNIYVGKVMNVEAGIQAAFINFGLEHNGFLHISDLHPQYFPGEDDETTESVGSKTPRRDRPPIQKALRRGQEILVQVIKEGIGTKGPTLTSYLSIPGRYLVMMPAMDRVGVSRKIEDDELRRKMRDTLDQLDLPEGFGFILRTAGMERAKTELKRDLAYLNRLWRDMERRRKAGGGPRLLYAESDLLLRSLRDIITPDIKEIVIDDESALRRASRFLKIFAPRSAPKLLHYDAPAPMYHAYNIEEQIHAMYSRRVDLPSGGYLIIDETEALVAIDVNSGKMRGHGDAETTAFRTNQEAVDQICRQMKLRDLGGLVVLDLIDMRSRAHRRDIETQLRNNLKNDPARSKALAISQFGLVELTRQRMHGSMRSANFTACPECEGSGLVRRPDSVTSAAMRHLSALLASSRIEKIELVVSPRVASELLSFKRREMLQLEANTGKTIAVRVSETIPVDRVTFYAYDERGADVDVDRMPKLQPASAPKLWAESPASVKEALTDPVEDERRARRELDEAMAATEEPEIEQELDALHLPDALDDLEEEDAKPKRKRRRRRRRRGKPADATADEKTEDNEHAAQAGEGEPIVATPPQGEHEQSTEGSSDESHGGVKKKRRRRRRRRRSGAAGEPVDANVAGEPKAISTPDEEKSTELPSSNGQASPAPATAPPKSRFAPRGDSWDIDPADAPPLPEPKKKSRSRRAKKKTSVKTSAVVVATIPPTPAEATPTPANQSTPTEGSASASASKKKTRRKKAAAKKKTVRKKKTTAEKKTTKKAVRKKKVQAEAQPVEAASE